MWLQNSNNNSNAKGIRKGGKGNGLVAVAVDKDKGSHYALKWAADSLVSRGETIILIHVMHATNCSSSKANDALVCNIGSSVTSPDRNQLDNSTKDLFLTFHCYCTRKDIQCLDVLLEDTDVVKAITEYVSHGAIENLVVGASSRHGFIRFKSSNMASSITKATPDFCTVYVISKGKISTVRSASRSAPHASPLLKHIQNQNKENGANQPEIIPSRLSNLRERDRISMKPHSWQNQPLEPAFERRGDMSTLSQVDFGESDSDISFVSSGRTSSVYDFFDSARTSRVSTSSDRSCGSSLLGLRFNDPMLSDSASTSFTNSPKNMDDAVEADMRRLKLELKQTMEMYSTACREALTAQNKLMELNHWRTEEEIKIEEARSAQEAALVTAEKEKARSKAALETAEALKLIAEVESHRRENVEVKALKEAEELRKLMENVAQTGVNYRRYTIEEIEEATNFFCESQKIGEGGYGPVYKCYLDHTPVAVKVLRPNAAQGKSQFQQEINILSCIRHPNMVLLLGACPEYGVLVYEYMSNGSLDDCLFRKKNNAVLPWQLRVRIAADIGTGLLFLHQTKPEPLVHRDLKPGNILLDQNYVSKISDVGLARLVPAVAENVTQLCMTSAAGTFCYIDPEYQQTGMLGVKSDVYSLGIIFLQLLTGRSAMGLAHHVQQAIEKGTFAEMLDPSVAEWPYEQALCHAKMAVKCAELRRKDRPDLGKEILPELNKFRDFAEEMMCPIFLGGRLSCTSSTTSSPNNSQPSIHQDVLSNPHHDVEQSRNSSPSTVTEEKD